MFMMIFYISRVTDLTYAKSALRRQSAKIYIVKEI